jgi:hypothetical protein
MKMSYAEATWVMTYVLRIEAPLLWPSRNLAVWYHVLLTVVSDPPAKESEWKIHDKIHNFVMVKATHF